jgi:hypothetical protein
VKTPPVQRAASRKRLAAKGQALGDGTAPVPDLAYLRKAIRAKGRVDPAKWPALKRLIIKRARQLKATSTPGVKGSWPFQAANDGTAIELVGPKGYEHNWVYVGPQGQGAKVFHPRHGHGTVTAHDGTLATVKFDKSGAEHSFAARPGTGKARLTPREAAAETAPPAGPALTVAKGRRDWAVKENGRTIHSAPTKKAAQQHADTITAQRAANSTAEREAGQRQAQLLASRGIGPVDFRQLKAGDQFATSPNAPLRTVTGVTHMASGASLITWAKGAYTPAGHNQTLLTPGTKVYGRKAARGHAHANQQEEAISLATMTRRMPVVRGPADVQLSRTAPGMITAMHKSSGMKIGVIIPSGKGYAGKHADGTPTGASGSQQGALAGLITHHNKRARGFPAAQQGGTASYAGGHDGAVDLAGALPFTSANSSMDGPRVTTMGAGKPAATTKPSGGLSPYAAVIYRKLIAKGLKPAQAMAMAKRAGAMHAKASAA